MNRTRRRKNKRKARQRKKAERLAQRRMVSLEVEELEIARGHDGFLRGAPEPVLVCALFSAQGKEVRLIARGTGHFDRPRRFPTVVTAPEACLARGRRLCDRREPLGVLVVALEEDSGEDIERLYALVQGASDIQVLETSDEPRALHMEDIIADASNWREAHEVDLLFDGVRFDRECGGDKWIAAAVFAGYEKDSHRVHLVSEDGRNDWTAVLRLR